MPIADDVGRTLVEVGASAATAGYLVVVVAGKEDVDESLQSQCRIAMVGWS